MMFSHSKQVVPSTENSPFVIDASRLRKNERLELKYDRDKNLIAVQKVTISLFKQRMEAKAITDINPGQAGKVMYQGSYWKARCDSDVEIKASQMVLVIGRYELTLLVIPTIDSSR